MGSPPTQGFERDRLQPGGFQHAHHQTEGFEWAHLQPSGFQYAHHQT